MKPSLLTRRQFTTTLAGMAALSFPGAKALASQTPEPEVTSLVIEIFGWEIVWDVPWEQAGFSPGTDEIRILDEYFNLVEEAAMDWIDLKMKEAFTWAEIHIGPFPGDGNHYEYTARTVGMVPFPEEVMREDFNEEITHILEFLMYDGVEIANFVRIHGKPGEGERTGIHIVSEATLIADAIESFMDVVTINGQPAIPAGEIDPNAIQARILPLVGTMTEDEFHQPRD